MDRRINEIVKELGVTISYDPNMDADGHYIAGMNRVVINSSYSEFCMTKALLHELGHAAQHQGNEELYQASFALHAKMECEAEEFAIKHLVKQFLDIHAFELEAFNYEDFVRDNDLDESIAPKVREWFLEYGR